MAITRRKARTK